MKSGRERFSTRRKLFKRMLKSPGKKEIFFWWWSRLRSGHISKNNTCNWLHMYQFRVYICKGNSKGHKNKLQQLTHHPHNKGTAFAGCRCLWFAGLPSVCGSRPSPPDPGHTQTRPICSACHWTGQQQDRDPKNLKKKDKKKKVNADTHLQIYIILFNNIIYSLTHFQQKLIRNLYLKWNLPNKIKVAKN